MRRIQMIWKRFLLWIGAVTLLVAGCAKPPAADVAAKKNTALLAEKATAHVEAAPASEADSSMSTLYEKLDAPTSTKLSLSSDTGKMQITVDADIVLPEVDGMPMIRIRARDFTQEEVTRLFAALCGDQTMYCCQLDRTFDESEICSGDLYTVEMRVSDGTFLGSYQGIEAVENPTDRNNRGAEFSVANNTMDLSKHADWGDERGASLRYYAKSDSLIALGFQYLSDESTTPADAEGLALLPQDARRKVDTFLQETGFPDYFTTGVYLAKPDTANGGEECAYVVTCSQSYHGVGQRTVGESVCSEIGNDDYENKQYKKQWHYERFYFYVDDSGIIGMRWISPSEIVDDVTEDTLMLSYGSMMQVFEQIMPVVYERNASLDYVRVLEYQVDRIALELQRVSEQNSIETGLLIPVWNFYGSFVWKYESDMISSDEMTESFPWSFLSINAIDGSIIDVAQGY